MTKTEAENMVVHETWSAEMAADAIATSAASATATQCMSATAMNDNEHLGM